MSSEGAMTASLPLLGELPSDWDVAPLSEVLMGGTRNGIYKPKKYHGSGAKVVNMGELFANPRLFDIPMRRLRLTESEESRFSLEVGDLLFARRSLVDEGAGKCSIVMELAEPTVFESSIIRARPDEHVADSLFLFYLFSSPFGKYSLGSIRREMAVAGITGADLQKLPIPVPPLAKQKRIARILGTLDDKIELNRRMNRTLEAIARAIFKSWFVDFDPVHAKAEGREPVGMDPETAALFPDSFQDSPLGKIPKGWEVSTIGKEFNLIMGQSPPGTTYNEVGEGMPFFQGRRDFGFRFPVQRVYCTAPKRVAEEGDTLVSVRAPVGDVNMAPLQLCLGRGLAGVRHNSGSRSFTYYSMLSLRERFREYESEGTVFGAINKSQFSDLDWVNPGANAVAAFEDSLFAADESIRLNELESLQLARIRDMLLPELLSGSANLRDEEP